MYWYVGEGALPFNFGCRLAPDLTSFPDRDFLEALGRGAFSAATPDDGRYVQRFVLQVGWGRRRRKGEPKLCGIEHV